MNFTINLHVTTTLRKGHTAMGECRGVTSPSPLPARYVPAMSSQGRRKIDNWGGGNIHIFVFCTTNFFGNRNLDFKINCFYSL